MGTDDEIRKNSNTWFVPDRPIESPLDDEFSHDTVAALLAQGIRDSHAPATIGLLGQFGAGKSSVANLSIAKLEEASKYDAVHVSAEKHSGEARSRNIVHSIAGDMVNRGYINQSHANSRLRSLRMSVRLSTPVPGEMRIARVFREPKGQSLGDVWFLLGLGAVLFVVLTLAAVLVGDPLDAIFSTSGVLALVLFIGTILYRQITAVIESFFAVPTQQESTQRAEAADDVERVFADLVEHHWEKRNGRRLVVFVDDIDRLGPADVLDAMRAIKSLQAVPKGKEPIFVVSCDDQIVLTALTDATSMGDEAEAIDPEIGLAAAEGLRPRAALGYLDKFFSLRINMPPHVDDDMTRFVTTMLPSKHPIREMLEPSQVDSVLLVLARGDVLSPRHLIHRLNRFLADYRLVDDREGQPVERRRLHPGDATARPVMLARLAVLSLDYRDFFGSLLLDEALLLAADKLARRDGLNEIERELLLRHGVARRVGDELDSDLEWAETEALRTYLVSTFPSVERGGGSLVPLLYLAEPESGRVLGNETLGLLVRAVRNGDAEQVESAVGRLPDEQLPVAAAELVSVVAGASSAELATVLTGATSAVELLGASGPDLADAVADRATAAPPGTMATSDLLEIAEVGTGGHEHGLLKTVTLAPDGEEPVERDHRLRLAAGYLARKPQVPHLAEAVSAHLETVDEHGGWELAPEWIDIASVPGAPTALISGISRAVVQLARATPDLEYDETCEALVAMVSALPEPEKELLQAPIRSLGPQSEGAFRLLVEMRSCGCHPASANDALALASAVAALDDDDLQAAALRLLIGIVSAWKTTEFKKKDPDEDPTFVADSIGTDIASALDGAGSGLLTAFTDGIKRLSTAQRALDKVAEASLDFVENQPADLPLEEPWQTWLAALSETTGSLSDSEGFASRLLLGFEQTGDLAPKTKSLLPQIAHLASNSDGPELLRPMATTWSSTIAAATAPFTREPQVAAFGALAAVDEGLANETAAPCLRHLTQRLNQNNEIPTNLKVVVDLPWAKAQTTEAVALLAQHLSHLPEITQATDLLRRAMEAGVDVPDAVTKRFFDATAERPAQIFPSADSIWDLFSTVQQNQLLAKACGVSNTADQRAASTPAEQVPGLLVSAHLEGRLAEACGVNPASNTGGATTVAVLESFIDNEIDLGSGELQLLRTVSRNSDADIAQALIARADGDAPYAGLALGYLSDLEIGLADSQLRRLDEVIAQRLASWSVPTAQAAAAVRQDGDVGSELKDVVEELLKGPDASRSLAQAIRPGKEKRKRGKS